MTISEFIAIMVISAILAGLHQWWKIRKAKRKPPPSKELAIADHIERMAKNIKAGKTKLVSYEITDRIGETHINIVVTYGN